MSGRVSVSTPPLVVSNSSGVQEPPVREVECSVDQGRPEECAVEELPSHVEDPGPVEALAPGAKHMAGAEVTSVVTGETETAARPAAAGAEVAETAADEADTVRAATAPLVVEDDFGHDFFAREYQADGHHGPFPDEVAVPQPMSSESRRAMYATLAIAGFFAVVIGGYMLYQKLWVPTPVELGGGGPVSPDALLEAPNSLEP